MAKAKAKVVDSIEQTEQQYQLGFDNGADSINELSDIVLRGGREHNLKGINVEIPRDKFVVVTGLSGSGKSSLAFDTLYA